MAVNLSPVGGVAAQFFTNSGAVLTGGKIFTYAAGTTTPQAAYTTSQGNVAWTNPIVLDAAGRVPSGGEIWLTDGLIYKFVLKDANDVLIATYDNITGINSNSVAFVNQQEIVTATAGQTVFNLGINYQPATNSLSVFVDGVNQYGPGAQYSYVETDSNTVTFNTGLHVGAEVKFTTTQQQSAGAVDASQVSYDPPFTGSVVTNVEAKLAQYVSVADFGASSTATAAINRAAIQAAIDSIPATKGGAIYFPQSGVYNIDGNIDTNNRVLLIEGNGATLNLTTSTSYMISVTDVGCEIRNLFLSKNSGVTASAFYMSGIRHVINNVQSGDSKWSNFIYGEGLKESHFSKLNVYLDAVTQTGNIFSLNYCVNNTLSDSFLGYCDTGVYASSVADPTYSNYSEGLLTSNVIIVYAKKAFDIAHGTLFSIINCCFDFCETWGVYQSNGNNLKVMNTWIASNTTNGFIGVGTVNTVYGVSVVGNVFVRGASAITGTAGVSLSGPNALVVGNAFQGGMNGGIVTDTGSQVIGNTVSSPGANIVANLTNSTILGTLSVAANLSVAGSKGIFPQGVSGSASTQVGGATLPALARGFITVEFDDGAGVAQYKIPYYNV